MSTEQPKTPPQPAPFAPAVPGPHEVSPVIARVGQNVRGPESTGPAPQPEPFREPSAQHLSGSLSVPSGTPTETAHRLGLEHPGEAPKPALSGSVFGAPDRVTTVASHEQIRDYARKYAPR
jgi:hypothetical protein